MEENENKEKVFEKMKKKVAATSLKSRILIVVMAVAIVFIVFSAVVNLTISPDTFTDPTKRSAWITKTLITLTIATFGVIMGEMMAKDALQRKSGGIYQTALIRYKGTREKALKNQQFFADWFIWFKAVQLKQKQKDFLIEAGMEDSEVIISHLEEIDLEGLGQHPLKMSDGTRIRKKNEYQIECIRYVKEGKVKIDTYSPNYYLQEVEGIGEAYLLETAPKLVKLENQDTWFSRGFKLTCVLLWSVMFGMLTADDFMNVGDVQAWFNLVGRIASLFTAFLSGWSSASRSVTRMSQMLDDRCVVLDEFELDLNSRRFIPMTYEEKAKKEEEEYEQSQKDRRNDGDETKLHEELVTAGNPGQSERTGLVSDSDQAVSVEA